VSLTDTNGLPKVMRVVLAAGAYAIDIKAIRKNIEDCVSI
jgi:hypothetical protein